METVICPLCEMELTHKEFGSHWLKHHAPYDSEMGIKTEESGMKEVKEITITITIRG